MLASTQQEAISVCAPCDNQPDDIVCGLPERPTPLMVATATQIGGGAVTPDTQRPIIFLPRGQEPLVGEELRGEPRRADFGCPSK